jgi:hypothetical protein
MVVLGNLAVRLQSLQKTLLWDSENMRVTNIGADEIIRTTKLSTYSSDIVTRNVERQSKEWVEWNALGMCNEWIKHEYHNGFEL